MCKGKIRVILCLAEQVEEWNVLSKRTLLRLWKAYGLFLTGNYDYILVSGGIFNPPKIQTRPAAHLMKEWLLSKSIKEENVLVEDTSLDTYQNVANSVEIIRQKAKTDMFYPLCKELVTVVSDQHHLRRVRMIIEGHFSTDPIVYEDSGYRLPFSEKLKELIFFAITFCDRDGVKWLARCNRHWRDQS